jgi:malate dehydrogenase (oxaloacetate-decarboxylating)(NADP+)
MSEELKKSALRYHSHPRPGKLEIKATKPLANSHDLSLAYSPGVAYACTEIEKNPVTAADYTSRGNLVAVITNGTAVLGLGAIGSLASKPVMEGKAVLFKEFANIDVFDIEVDELDPEKFIDTVARLEPSFGGINLEDIKAPECFIIEKGLKERMNIPVFHDDQHGTAIVVSAAVYNGLRVVGKKIDEVKLVASGAGAAALACLDLLVEMGLKKENITVTDIAGVVYEGRTEEMDPYKARYAVDTDKRTLQEVLPGADIFLGLSAAGVLKPEYLKEMADSPLIMALANPVPEIMPDEAEAVRPDAVIATGRSDFPNQVNNVLCFPFLFRGALDVGATQINEEMKMAAVKAIADLALAQPSDTVRSAYGGQNLIFGPEYLIPKPFDKRLMEYVAPAVARAAMDTGVAQRPIEDINAYREKLHHSVFKTGMTMKPVFDSARVKARRVVFAEGEDEKVLQVIPQIVSQGIARPIVIGRRDVIVRRLEALSLNVDVDEDFDLVDPHNHDDYFDYVDTYYDLVSRKGYSPIEARYFVRTNSTVLAALMVRQGRADAMICGTRGRYMDHLGHIEDVIGRADGVSKLTSMNALVMHTGNLFITDAYVQDDPSAEDIAEIVGLCRQEVKWFGEEPRAALLSSSNFGTRNSPAAVKMREALVLIREKMPDLQIEGEMHADMALSIKALQRRFPNTELKEPANLLVMPNQDAANISYNLLQTLGDGTAIGPILVGAAQSAHVVTPSITVRGLLNMTAVAAVRAN